MSASFDIVVNVVVLWSHSSYHYTNLWSFLYKCTQIATHRYSHHRVTAPPTSFDSSFCRLC